MSSTVGTSRDSGLKAKLSRLALAALAASLIVACGGGESETSRPAISSWTYEGASYSVLSGIAVPLVGYTYWDPKELKQVEVPEGQGVKVYLSDQQLGCDLYPFPDRGRFPVLPTATGATITLSFHQLTTLDNIGTEFAVETGNSSSGLGTDSVRGAATLAGPTATQRVEGWLEFDQQEEEGSRVPSVTASGAFDVPLCP